MTPGVAATAVSGTCTWMTWVELGAIGVLVGVAVEFVGCGAVPELFPDTLTTAFEIVGSCTIG